MQQKWPERAEALKVGASRELAQKRQKGEKEVTVCHGETSAPLKNLDACIT